jgi:hypothetical protein
MAETSTSESARTLILRAIKQKNPDIRPGETFDWLIVNGRLRHSLSAEDFTSAMKELGAAGLIGADEAKRQFVLTEKGFEALQ